MEYILMITTMNYSYIFYYSNLINLRFSIGWVHGMKFAIQQ